MSAAEDGRGLSATVIRGASVHEQSFGPIDVKELLTAETTPDMSVAVIRVHGKNEVARNALCDAAYLILNGGGTFTFVTANDQRTEDFVRAGDLVYIPKGLFYQSSGMMTMVSFFTPAFDQEQVEKIEEH
jgi:mannose-6-phosphate isomerase-like protein (cupin superfamily)